MSLPRMNKGKGRLSDMGPPPIPEHVAGSSNPTDNLPQYEATVWNVCPGLCIEALTSLTPVAWGVIMALGQDPYTVTSKEMDALDARLKCSPPVATTGHCRNHDGWGVAIMTWRGAVSTLPILPPHAD